MGDSNCLRVGQILQKFQFVGNSRIQQNQKSTFFGVGLIAYCAACECCDKNLPSLKGNCKFDNYVTNPDDVVVGEHKKTYSGLTQLPYNFITSTAGTAFLNKYASDHGHYYGFREFRTGYRSFCTSDEKHISTEKDTSLTFSNTDGSYFYSNSGYLNILLNYRPKICGFETDKNDGECEQDWSLVFNKKNYMDVSCRDVYDDNSALFVKTSLYKKIAASCDLTSIR